VPGEVMAYKRTKAIRITAAAHLAQVFGSAIRVVISSFVKHRIGAPPNWQQPGRSETPIYRTNST